MSSFYKLRTMLIVLLFFIFLMDVKANALDDKLKKLEHDKEEDDHAGGIDEDHLKEEIKRNKEIARIEAIEAKEHLPLQLSIISGVIIIFCICVAILFHFHFKEKNKISA